MEFICIPDRFLFLIDTKDVTLIWVEAHESILFPSCSYIKVLLKVSSIIDRVYLFVYDAVVSKDRNLLCLRYSLKSLI